MAHHQLAHRYERKAQGSFCCDPRAGCRRTAARERRNTILLSCQMKTDLRTLAATIEVRWICEQAHQQLKEELGLDHFEGRSWQGLHRHALMTMIAYAFLQYRRLKTARR